MHRKFKKSGDTTKSKKKKELKEKKIKKKSGVKEKREKKKRIMETAIQKLAERYNFDAKEAMHYLQSGTRRPRIPLPFCGEIMKDWCHGVRLNHGLYSQCTMTQANGSVYCKTCLGQCNRNSNNEPTYGTIEARAEAGNSYQDPKGKKIVNYEKVLNKLNITKEEANRAAEELGWNIPESVYEIKERKKGRPAKNKTSTEPKKKRGRGRPRKTTVAAPVVLEETDNLIESLVKAAQAEPTSEHKPEPQAEQEPEPQAEHKPEPQAEQEPEPQAEHKPEPQPEPQPESQAEQEPEPQPEPQPESQAEQEPESQTEQEPESQTEQEPEEQEDEELDEEELEVEEYTYNGKTYLLSDDGTLYDAESQEEVGMLNEGVVTLY